MKKSLLITMLVVLVSLSFLHGTPLTGTKIIGTMAPYDYATLTDAISSLNLSGAGTGGVTFQVQEGTYAENPPALTASGTTNDQIIFEPVAGANPVLTPSGGADSFGFKLDGADWVTFENIDITGPNTLIYAYWLANGAQNCTIKNCSITVPYGTTANYGIFSSGVAGNPNSGCSFLSNDIATSCNGIFIINLSGSEAQEVNVQGNELTGISSYGIYASYCLGSTIQYNSIAFNDAGTTPYTGIYLSGTSATFNVHHNEVSGGCTSGSVFGIHNNQASPIIDHNTISNIYNTGSSWFVGMFDSGSGTWTNNTISGINNTGSSSFSGFYASSAGTSIWNNNTLSDVTINGSIYAAWCANVTSYTFNNNVITDLTSPANVYGHFVDTGNTNCSIYNNKYYNYHSTGTGSNRINGIYIYGGSTNSVYNNMVCDLRNPGATTVPQIRGISVVGGITDNVWNNTVYLNATGTGSSFSSTALYVSDAISIDLKNNIFVNKSTSGSSGRTVAFWKTTAGVGYLTASSDKNIYYAGTPSAVNLIGYFSSTPYQTLTEYKTMAGTKDQGSYTEDVPFLSSISPYDLHIRSDVMTQVEGNAIVIQPPVNMDIDGDQRSAGTPDIGADEGEFNLPISGTKIIGSVSPYDYNTFTAAIKALNTLGVGSGGVIFQVQDGTYNENPPPITASGTATDQIIFEPLAGANPELVITWVVFALNGADWVTIDNIDVNNQNPGFGSCIVLANGANHNTIKNCTLSNNVTTPPMSFGINSVGAAGNPNSHCSFINNTLQCLERGINITNVSNSPAQNINIQGNVLSNITFYGISASFCQNSTILSNSIGQPESITPLYSIYLAGNTSTFDVQHNTLTGSLFPVAAIYGIYNDSTTATIAHNTITSIYITSDVDYIGMFDGGSGTWTNNSITSICNDGSALFIGFKAQTTGTSTWFNNILNGITCNGSVIGAECWSAANYLFSNNEISNITSLKSITGQLITGGTNINVHNNKYYDLHSTATEASTVTGIQNNGGTISNIYNNMIYDLHNPAGTNVPQIRNISISGGTTNNIWHNTLYLSASGSDNTFSSAALYVSDGTAIDLKNNIFVNKSNPGSSGMAVTIWKTTDGVDNLSESSDKNIYYAGTPGTRNLIGYFNTTAYQTLAEYKTMAGSKDQGSYTEDVPFLSSEEPYNLHINPNVMTYVEGNAIVIQPPVSFDIDGDERSETTPDIGADEGDFLGWIAALDTPVLTATMMGTEIKLDWQVISGAQSYHVYASDDPYNWPAEPVVSVQTNSYQTDLLSKQFFKVVASTLGCDIIPNQSVKPAKTDSKEISGGKPEPLMPKNKITEPNLSSDHL